MTSKNCGKVGHNKSECKNKGQGVNGGASGFQNAAEGTSNASQVAESTINAS